MKALTLLVAFSVPAWANWDEWGKSMSRSEWEAKGQLMQKIGDIWTPVTDDKTIEAFEHRLSKRIRCWMCVTSYTAFTCDPFNVTMTGCRNISDGVGTCIRLPTGTGQSILLSSPDNTCDGLKTQTNLYSDDGCGNFVGSVGGDDGCGVNEPAFRSYLNFINP